MVRVRFAPSPTGQLHVGNVRTALYNWLFARQKRGSFILRVEDTDAERSEERFERQILDDLRWLGLDWDEGLEVGGASGPYRQTERFALYQRYADQLTEEGKAYLCFCSPEELERERQAQLAAGQMPRYSGKCRALDPAVARSRRDGGQPAALRLAVRPGRVGFDDLVFGRIEIDCDQVGDPVLLRSDRSPNYNFAVVIDDLGMQISHVIRGDGHVPNTHRQILVYEALGAQPPEFAHLSTILGKDGAKLSKRHGATSIDEFRRQGFQPEALVNYLALLGWAPPGEGNEILSVEQLIEQFDLKRVHRSPAIFDPEKLDWVSRSHLRRRSPAELLAMAMPFLQAEGVVGEKPIAASWLERVIDAILNYSDTLSGLAREAKKILEFDPDELARNPQLRSELEQPAARAVLEALLQRLEKIDNVDLAAYKQMVAEVKAETGQKGKALFHPIRLALTGREAGPELDKLVPIFEEGQRLELSAPIPGCRQRVRQVLQIVGPRGA